MVETSLGKSFGDEVRRRSKARAKKAGPTSKRVNRSSKSSKGGAGVRGSTAAALSGALDIISNRDTRIKKTLPDKELEDGRVSRRKE